MYWCSPPCKKYSVPLGLAADQRYLTEADAIALACINIRDKGNPRKWFIENPVGLLRHRPFVRELESFRKEYSNCHYRKPCRNITVFCGPNAYVIVKGRVKHYYKLGKSDDTRNKINYLAVDPSVL